MCIKVFIFVIFLLDWNKCKELHYNQVSLRCKTYVHEGKNLSSEYIYIKIVRHTNILFYVYQVFHFKINKFANAQRGKKRTKIKREKIFSTVQYSTVF